MRIDVAYLTSDRDQKALSLTRKLAREATALAERNPEPELMQLARGLRRLARVLNGTDHLATYGIER